ncbi:hypothetical protein L9F63_010362 [Diploptera punctata]|uniref:N-acetyltransferase domain-containing protein n=1 Tax=Diploptera punctata TaxID=6984 RepID=A0AAD8EQ94_DIPPU|nr:hypothetical protein L9F63_010362 [Diploptera punctata]
MVDSTITHPQYSGLSLQERIKAPLVWARLTSGVRIEDLQEKRFPEALQLLREYFLTEETLCRASEISEDEESVMGLFEIVTLWMKDLTSLIAVEEGTGEVVGLLICRVQHLLDHTRTFSRIQFIRGVAFHKIMDLRYHMHKYYDVYENYDVSQFFRIYAICIKKTFRGQGIGMGLLYSSLNLARLMGQTVAMGVFTCLQSQRMAAKLGMVPHLEIDYAQWIKNDEIVFTDPGAGNYSIMLMAMRIPNVPHITFISEQLQEEASAKPSTSKKQRDSKTSQGSLSKKSGSIKSKNSNK